MPRSQIYRTVQSKVNANWEYISSISDEAIDESHSRQFWSPNFVMQIDSV